MNLADPRFRAQARKITMIMALAAMAMSLAAIGLSLYALHLQDRLAGFEEILKNPAEYPEETRLVSCLIDGGERLYPKFMCDYYGGEPADSSSAAR